MNRQASILFNFIDSSISGNSLALQEATAPHSYYQRLIGSLLAHNLYTTEGFQSVGRQLTEIARHAYFAQQMDVVEQVSQVMLALPISKELKAAALYYQAIYRWRQGNADEARRLLERVTEESASDYRARAWLTIGATYFGQGKADAALPFYVVAGKAAIGCDLLTLAESQKMIAVVRSLHGEHKQALGNLEQLFPLARAVGKHYPALYYDYLNSLAVELGEVGRLDEAEAACAIVLASPFSTAYPNWAETCDELEAKRTSATPSIVAVSLAPEPAPQAQPQRNPKPVRALACIWPAHVNQFLQTTVLIASAITVIGITQSICDRVRFCLRPRGPPPLLQRAFSLVSERFFPFAEVRRRAALAQFITGFCWAQLLPSALAVSVGVSSSWDNETLYRSLPFRCRRGEYNSLNLRAANSRLYPLPATDPRGFQGRGVSRRVNPSKPCRLDMNWAGCCGHNSPPDLTAPICAKGMICPHIWVQKGEICITQKAARLNLEMALAGKIFPPRNRNIPAVMSCLNATSTRCSMRLATIRSRPSPPACRWSSMSPARLLTTS